MLGHIGGFGVFAFQSTRPRGARLLWISFVGHTPLFQSTRPRGARPGKRAFARPSKCFNPRARGGRDIFFFMGDVVKHLFQSTRPRGARRDGSFDKDKLADVSIHAPAGGATESLTQAVILKRVSIHAPAGGATDIDFRLIPDERCFNPRARGGRDYLPRKSPQFRRVSIHAPAGGATPVRQLCDSIDWFQSTRPRGARPALGKTVHAIWFCFNPRARGGRDQRN